MNISRILGGIKPRFKFAIPQKCDFLVHASSLGEAKVGDKIIKYADKKGKKGIMTVFTESALKNFKSYPLPLDPILSTMFLKYSSPKKIFIIEHDIWPQFLIPAKLLRIKTIILGGRVSERTAKIYSIFSKLIDNVYPADDIMKNRFEKSGFKVSKTTNIKLISLIDEKENTSKNRVIFISAREDEIKISFELFDKIKGKGIKFFLAPRHPIKSYPTGIPKISDFGEMPQSIEKAEEKSDFILIDKIGVGKYLNLFTVGIVGGTFSKIGGHDPIELIANKVFPIVGPNHTRIKSEVEELKKNGIVEISDKNDIHNKIIYAIQNIEGKREKIKNFNMEKKKEIVSVIEEIIEE